MPDFLSYTIFADRELTEVRHVANLVGREALDVLDIFRRELRREPREGDVANGCRIDRIGSEDAAKAALALRATPLPADTRSLFAISRRDGKEPCGECHIQPDETCNICGAKHEANAERAKAGA
jgi:hypothetical protein